MSNREIYVLFDSRLFDYGYVEKFDKLLKNFDLKFIDIHQQNIPNFNDFNNFGNVLTIYLNEVFFPLNDFTIDDISLINPKKYKTIVFALNMDDNCLMKLQELNSEFYIDKERFLKEYGMLYETYFTHLVTKFDMMIGG